MNNGDIVLLAVAGYIAVTSLVRLMRQRRDQVYRELESEIQQEREQKRREQQAARRQARRDRAA